MKKSDKMRKLAISLKKDKKAKALDKIKEIDDSLLEETKNLVYESDSEKHFEKIEIKEKKASKIKNLAEKVKKKIVKKKD